MMPLHCQETATILLLIVPAVSCLVPSLSVHHTQSARIRKLRQMTRNAPAGKTSATQLSLGIDPTDIVAQHSHILHHHNDPTSVLDFLSSFTLAKASAVPGQSIAPLPETIKDSISTDADLLRVIPDLPSMPGGAPRSGNGFLAESFWEIYKGAPKFNPQDPSWTANGDGVIRPTGTIDVSAQEWDFVARYVDLIGRLPLAATVYALIDFFLINAEEDVDMAEFFDEEDRVEAMLEVETTIVQQRILGFLAVATATFVWSLLSYHPVPLNEL